MNSQRDHKIENVQQIYREQDIHPPCTDEEVCSAILNGDCFIRATHSYTKVERIQDPNLKNHANILANHLCMSLAKKRNYLLNDLRMQNSIQTIPLNSTLV